MNLSGVVARKGAIHHVGGLADAPPVGAVPYAHFLSPSAAVTGSAPFTIHVRGSGFQAGDVIVWNGGEEATTFVSATELTTGVDPTTASPGTRRVPVAVKRGPYVSRSVEFAFVDLPDPHIFGLAPTTHAIADGDCDLVVDGENFEDGDVLTANGIAIAGSAVTDANTMTATLPMAGHAAGNVAIAVKRGTRQSNVVPLLLTEPAPPPEETGEGETARGRNGPRY